MWLLNHLYHSAVNELNKAFTWIFLRKHFAPSQSIPCMMECYDAEGIVFHHVNNDACMNGPLSKGQFFALFFFCHELFFLWDFLDDGSMRWTALSCYGAGVINSLWPSYARLRYRSSSILVRVMTCWFNSTMPLSEPVLICHKRCYVALI